MRFDTDTVQSEGLHILHPNTLVPEQCLLEIEITGAEGDFAVHGKVVWYDRNPEESPHAFQVGIEFLDRSRDMKKKIQQTIREQLTATS